jgi:hypothetical protein
VRFRVSGTDKPIELACSQSGTTEFVGQTDKTFEILDTCRITVKRGGRTAVQIRRAGTVSCTATEDAISCSGP